MPRPFGPAGSSVLVGTNINGRADWTLPNGAPLRNALPGKGVHIVTVNDYLARRDAGWMGQVLAVLGLTTGAVCIHQFKPRRFSCCRG